MSITLANVTSSIRIRIPSFNIVIGNIVHFERPELEWQTFETGVSDIGGRNFIAKFPILRPMRFTTTESLHEKMYGLFSKSCRVDNTTFGMIVEFLHNEEVVNSFEFTNCSLQGIMTLGDNVEYEFATMVVLVDNEDEKISNADNIEALTNAYNKAMQMLEWQ